MCVSPSPRWISQKYPKIVKDCIEEIPEWVAGTEIPVNSSEPNPNGIEFDNLYLVRGRTSHSHISFCRMYIDDDDSQSPLHARRT